MAGECAVSEHEPQPAGTGCRYRPSREHQRGAGNTRGRAGAASLAKGMTWPFWPCAAARLPLAPVWGHEPGPGGGTHPIAGCREGNGAAASVARGRSPCSPQDRRLHCWSTNVRGRAASGATGPDVGPEGAARAGAANFGDRQAASQWAPAQGTSILIGTWPRQPRLLTPDAR